MIIQNIPKSVNFNLTDLVKQTKHSPIQVFKRHKATKRKRNFQSPSFNFSKWQRGGRMNITYILFYLYFRIKGQTRINKQIGNNFKFIEKQTRMNKISLASWVDIEPIHVVNMSLIDNHQML